LGHPDIWPGDALECLLGLVDQFGELNAVADRVLRRVENASGDALDQVLGRTDQRGAVVNGRGVQEPAQIALDRRPGLVGKVIWTAEFRAHGPTISTLAPAKSPYTLDSSGP